MKLAIVGLGQMGKPIAMNLARSGLRLIASSRSTGPFKDLEALGVETTPDLLRVAQAEIVFLCLPNAEAVRAVLLGAGGLAGAMKPGSIVVDLSTIDHASAVELAASLAARRIQMIDAPISGMEARAIDATLTVMCGGDPQAFESVHPYLRLIGSTILFMGPPGSGQLTKLINQLLFDINVAALAEVLPMAISLGLDPDKIAGVVNSGTGRSYASKFFVPRMLQGNFNDGYAMKDAYKDLASGARLSGERMIPMPVLAAATATYQMALLQGHGDKDKGAMLLVYEQLLGVAFRSRLTDSSDH